MPQEGESKLAKLRPSLPKADAPHPPSWLQALPLHHHPLAGGGLPDRGGFLTLFSSWKWKPSFRQRGRQALGRGAENILESAGGGLGPAGAAGRQAVQSPLSAMPRRALLPAVEFFRVFLSHHVEPVCNGSILEGKGTESRFLVSGPDPVQCGRKGRGTLSRNFPDVRGRPERFLGRAWTPDPRLGARALMLLELMPDDSS